MAAAEPTDKRSGEGFATLVLDAAVLEKEVVVEVVVPYPFDIGVVIHPFYETA